MSLFRTLCVVFVASLFLPACSEPAGVAGQQRSAPPPKVSTLTLQAQAVELKISLPGRITPYRQSQVRPQVDGVVTKRLFEEGAQVIQGQQLYQIDDARYAAQLNSTFADLESAKANLITMQAKSARYQDLASRKAVSQQEYDDVIAQTAQARAAIGVAQAAVAVAQVNLDYTKVYAPIDGQISRSYITEGALVTTNQAQQLASITQLDPVYLDMQESGKAVLELREQMRKQSALPVTVLMDETKGKVYQHQGQIKFSEVTVDESTGAVTLRALIPNPDSVLLPGLFVQGQVDMGTVQGFLVPQRAAVRLPDGSVYVMIVNAEDKVEKRNIEVLRIQGEHYIVSGGLQENDRLIVVGYQKVQVGMQVTPLAWQDPTSSPARAQP